MLPKIKNQLFLVSELSAIFTKKDDELVEILGILTRLADGHGLMTNTGAHGERGYSNIYFNMVGAAVDIPHKVYKYLGYLGPKLYFLRLPKTNKTEDDYINEMDQDEYPLRFQKVREALNDYLNIFAKCPDTEVEEGSTLMKITCSKSDNTTAKHYIVKLAMMLSHLRAVVPTWDTAGHGGTDYAHATAISEEPDRAITQLRNLARGHALSQGRDHITLEDIPLVVKVVLSTASIDRVNILDLLITHKGKLTTSIIEDSLNMSAPTARKTMTEFKAIELVDMPKQSTETEELTIILKDSLNWFLGEEFSNLRQGFIPRDNSEYLKKPNSRPDSEDRSVPDEVVRLKEKSPPSQSTPYECPRCSLRDIDPSKITEHLESFHGCD